MLPSAPSADALDQATAEMLAAAAVVAKMFMQTDPADELTDDLWEACQRFERSVGRVRELRGEATTSSEPAAAGAA